MLFLTVAYWKYIPHLYILFNPFWNLIIFVSFHARNTTILTNKATYPFRWNHYSVNRYRYKISNDFIMATIFNMSSCGFLGQYSQHFLPRGPNRFCCYIILVWKGLPGVTTNSYSSVIKEMKCCEYDPWFYSDCTFLKVRWLYRPMESRCFMRKCKFPDLARVHKN